MTDHEKAPKPIVSRCTGRIPVPSDPRTPWPPELLAKLFPPERRVAVWGEVIAVAYDQHNAQSTPTEKAG